MSELPRPVSEVLRPPVGEAQIRRMWLGVAARRGRQRQATPPLWAFGAVAAALACVVLWLGLPWLRAGDAGPLRMADGTEVLQVAVPAEGSSHAVVLSDGSRVTLSPGATLTPLENSARSFAALLGGGTVEVAVVPGGPRRWSFECGLATVEVVGTRFTLDRTPERLRVEVAEGTVLVRGERVPDRVQRLQAGDALEVSALRDASAGPAPTPGSPPADADEVAAPVPTSTASSAAASASALPRAPAWRELARTGAYGDAYRSLGQRGVEREAAHSSVEDLLALADVARLSGHPAEAVAPLRRVIQEHAGDGRAAVAAFTLGRLHLESLGQPAAAAASFAQALSLGVPGPLVEDARARLVEAHARAGNHAAAVAAAADYERQFPGGRHSTAVARWIAD